MVLNRCALGVRIVNKRFIILVFMLVFLIFNLNVGANNLELTIVYDNNPYREDLTTDWGFACYIKGVEQTILFDTGKDGSILLENMEKLAIDPNTIETVVISHIHQDHIGGLNNLLKVNNDIKVYVLDSFLSLTKNEIKENSAELIEVKESKKICEHVYTTGELGIITKEESLIINTKKGLVVITGCAHPGVVEIVKKTKRILDEEVNLLLGGFHMGNKSEEQITKIVNELKKLGVKRVAPCHCSGEKARQIFAEKFRDDFVLTGVGKKIMIKDSF